jgi:hypothetical protein
VRSRVRVKPPRAFTLVYPLALAASLCAEPLTAAAEPASIPAHNRPDPSQPPARPSAAEVEPRIRKLFDAIVRDDPALAADSFFPRAAFLRVKDMRDPGRYFDRLRRRFDEDIHALHRAFPGIERAEYVRFELSQRGAFMRPHEEGNLLPYWASRHSFLHFRIDGRPQRLEVRVLITWDAHWYVIHLSEFRAPAR